MSKIAKTATVRNTAQVQGVKLEPVICPTDDAIFEAAFDGIRRRPVVAINGKGVQVVCCSRTAKKHGWKLVEKLFQRNPGAPVKSPKAKAEQRKADLAAVEAMLGTK